MEAPASEHHGARPATRARWPFLKAGPRQTANLVPPHRYHLLIIQDHVIAGGELVGAVYRPLEHGAIDDTRSSSIAARSDRHAVAPLEAVVVAHIWKVANSLTARQLANVSGAAR